MSQSPRQGPAVAATCRLTVPRDDPRLGGLGEVATLPDFPAEIRAPAGTMAGVSG